MKRLPDKQEILRSFLIILTVVNFWSLTVFLYYFPGLVKQLTIFDLFSVLSYVLLTGMVESLAITLFLVILSILLPEKLLRSDFSVRTAVIIFLAVIYIIPFHTIIPRFDRLIFEIQIIIIIAVWTLFYITELILFHFAILRHPNFTAKIEGFIDRLGVLGAIYLILDLIAVGVVIANNWS